MIRWREAYERISKTDKFRGAFGGQKSAEAFRFMSLAQQFTSVAATSTPGTYGTPNGPTMQSFPSGAVVLGITAAAMQAQTTAGAFQYAPSYSPGRRDLFGLSFSYTDEQLTVGGLIQAESLLGSGEDTIFPAKELMMGQNQGLLCSVASLTVAPTLSVTVVYHCMVPRDAA